MGSRSPVGGTANNGTTTCGARTRATEGTLTRHVDVADLHHEHHFLDLLHGVPLNPFLCPATSDRGHGRTPAASTSSSSPNVQYTVLAAWRSRGFSSLGSLALHSRGPAHPLTSRGVVRKLGQGHCGAQAFVPQERPEPSLPPSHGGSSVIAMRMRPKREFHTEGNLEPDGSGCCS